MSSLNSGITEFHPILEGNLEVTSFKRSDITAEYVGWLNNENIVRFSEQRHMVHSIESCLEYFESRQSENSLFLSVKHRDAERTLHIGNVGVTIDWNNMVSDVSILIGREGFRGKGYGQLAWNMVLRSLFCDFSMRLVTAGTMEINHRMISLIKKSGMTIDGCLPRRFIHGDQEVGIVMASVDAQTFLSLLLQ